MSSVWVCVPSKRPPAEVEKWAQAWRNMGYRIMLYRDETERILNLEPLAQMWNKVAGYPGYATATNYLIKRAVLIEKAQWCVIGGDDVYPDTTRRADEIAAECQDHFARQLPSEVNCEGAAYNPTFGVMQPTGDRWGDSEQMRDRYGANRGAYIDRIAGSAWIGRDFVLRAYGSNGPLWHEYTHMFPDEELQCVAEKLGVFWQRRDLTQLHQHWARGDNRTREDIPEFLQEANSPEHWQRFQKLFNDRKAAGFPGHEVKA